MTCHQIWRYYKPVDPAKMVMLSDIERWCYNCAEKGHLGDDCKKPRPLYVQGGRIGVVISAFGEGNVPEWAKLSEAQLPRKRERSKSPSKKKPKKKRKEEKRRNDDSDDWFANRSRDPPKPRREIGGIKLNSTSNQTSNNATGSRQSHHPTLEDRIQSPTIKSSTLADRIESLARSRPPQSSKQYRSRNHQTGEDREWEDEVQRWRNERERDRINRR